MQGQITERLKTDEGYKVKCVQCGKHFVSKRSDATFHNANCRKKFARSAAQLNEWIGRLPDRGKELISIAKKNPTNKSLLLAYNQFLQDLTLALQYLKDV